MAGNVNQGIPGQGLLLCGEVYARHHSNLECRWPHSLPAPTVCLPQDPTVGALLGPPSPRLAPPTSVLILTRCFLGSPCWCGSCRLHSGGSTSGCTLGKEVDGKFTGRVAVWVWLSREEPVTRQNLGSRVWVRLRGALHIDGTRRW